MDRKEIYIYLRNPISERALVPVLRKAMGVDISSAEDDSPSAPGVALINQFPRGLRAGCSISFDSGVSVDFVASIKNLSELLDMEIVADLEDDDDWLQVLPDGRLRQVELMEVGDAKSGVGVDICPGNFPA